MAGGGWEGIKLLIQGSSDFARRPGEALFNGRRNDEQEAD
jgi:hypothetical protein